MLEGDGLAEKWAASHNHTNPSMNLFHNPHNKSTSRAAAVTTTTTLKHDCSEHERSSMFGTTMDEDDDEHSLDSYAMELSGPR